MKVKWVVYLQYVYKYCRQIDSHILEIHKKNLIIFIIITKNWFI